MIMLTSGGGDAKGGMLAVLGKGLAKLGEAGDTKGVQLSLVVDFPREYVGLCLSLFK